MFELDGVSKRYGPTVALQPLSLSLESGATTVLVGPSGCGKSTLLRLCAGLIRPTTGVVRFEGVPVGKGKALRQMRHAMGYVIQRGGLFPHLSVRKNASILAEHLGWSPEQIAARIRQLCRLTHFPINRLDAYPSQLSGGQKQRVSLMRAMMLDPKVLLFDEPLGALDPLIRAELQDELKSIFEELQKTVIFVTHDMGEAAHFADTVILMRAGEVVQAGPFEALHRNPTSPFVSRFLEAQRGWERFV